MAGKPRAKRRLTGERRIIQPRSEGIGRRKPTGEGRTWQRIARRVVPAPLQKPLRATLGDTVGDIVGVVAITGGGIGSIGVGIVLVTMAPHIAALLLGIDPQPATELDGPFTALMPMLTKSVKVIGGIVMPVLVALWGMRMAFYGR